MDWRHSHAVVLLMMLTTVACREPSSAPAAAPPPGRSDSASVQAAAPIIEASNEIYEPTRVLDARADEVLRETSQTLSALKTFALHAEESYDEIPSGQPRMLLTNIRRVAVQRPNRFAADAEGDSLNRSVWYDGQSLAIWDKPQHTYATVQMPGSIDGVLAALATDYGVDIPLGDLMTADLYATLTEGVTYSRYLGIHTAAGVPCHHLVFSQPTIEWQLWVDAGEHRLPRKMVITYVREPGEPQYTATIHAWRLSPTLPDTLFRFEPPDGAERIDFAAFKEGVPGVGR